MFWVTRAKTNIDSYDVKEIKITEIEIETCTTDSLTLRTVTAQFVVDGILMTMTFITNDIEGEASSICDLYKVS